MEKIMEIIARETGGKSYHTYKFSYDKIGIPAIDYDDESDKTMQWQDSGETERLTQSKNMKNRADKIKVAPPIFKYFLDGSRRVFKVDDISYGKQTYPVVAGQIGVGCCKRIEGIVTPELLYKRLVIALPNVSNADGWADTTFFAAKKEQINKSEIMQKLHLSFDKVLAYKSKSDQKENLEDLAIAAIQDFMIESEKEMVANLVQKKMLGHEAYLLKDGSLEYKEMKTGRTDLRSLQKIKNNYNWVVGVSKQFNPELCADYKGRKNSNYIADLPLYHRTPVARYRSSISGDVDFGVWYIRIRDKCRTNTPFDGVIKVEKMMMNNEIDNGIDSDIIDMISANLINERIPTCYGSDRRWANHLYPVYLTESFVKSKYISSGVFLQLF